MHRTNTISKYSSYFLGAAAVVMLLGAYPSILRAADSGVYTVKSKISPTACNITTSAASVAFGKIDWGYTAATEGAQAFPRAKTVDVEIVCDSPQAIGMTIVGPAQVQAPNGGKWEFMAGNGAFITGAANQAYDMGSVGKHFAMSASVRDEPELDGTEAVSLVQKPGANNWIAPNSSTSISDGPQGSIFSAGSADDGPQAATVHKHTIQVGIAFPKDRATMSAPVDAELGAATLTASIAYL